MPAKHPKAREIAVWQGIPGEAADLELRGKGAHRRHARWVHSDKPSPYRVTPPCPKYDACGGCPLMHVDSVGQSFARKSLVRNAFREVSLADVEISDEVSLGELAHFRHVIKLACGSSDRGHFRIGAPGRNTRRIVPIPDCLVITEELHNVMHAFVKLCIDFQVKAFEPGRGGLLRHLVCRQSALTGEVLVTLVTGVNHPVLQEITQQLSGRARSIVGIHLHINSEEGNAIYSRDDTGHIQTRHMGGRSFIIDRLADVDYRIGPGDFFQTNPALADRLYRDVLDMAGVGTGEVALVDLYSGVGGFALAAAARSSWALGVENNGGAVRRARESASAGNIPAEFIHSEVLEALPALERRLEGLRPVVVVNPARRGLEEGVLSGISKLHPSKVIYVSCNPKAMARDLAEAVANGWKIGRVVPYDMFPNTSHVEVVAELEPGTASEGPSRRMPRRKVVR
ncbi:MAG: 23S rRNA (uracil(1939)-C(5))-methyltransferase RlmD [Myxococcota bacterium]|nr:23S rRNA (uracil(1939)-C(5))-methyltransferase RlmD [Myxococcota bacterium]